MQPGQTITPGSEQTPPAPPSPEVPAEPTPQQPAVFPEPQPMQTHPDHRNAIQWSASEYVQHDKPAGWFLAVIGVGLVVAALLYAFFRDPITSFIVLLVAAIFGIAGTRRPRTLDYELNAQGIVIGSRFFPYETFKSFSLIEEGALDSIQLLPLKRFMPPLSLYYPPDQEEQILMTLSDYLPHEEKQHEAIDKFMRRIRF